MHFVGRKVSILKYFLYYIMYLADLLILLDLIRTQANAQSLCKLRINLLQGLPSLFLIILLLKILTCFYSITALTLDDSEGLLPVCSSQILAAAFMMLFIFLILSTIF